MYKIGFVDYFLDEWHADNYPRWIEQYADGRFVLHGAYGDVEPPDPAKRRNADFCRDHGIIHYTSLPELVADCDCLLLLAPDHPEEHLKLARRTIISNKPVFIDKTFAASEDDARAVFALADACGAPVYSTSALRYAAAYEPWKERQHGGNLLSFGPGEPRHYLVHQLEPLIERTQARPERALAFLGSEPESSLFVFLLEFACGLQACLVQEPQLGFRISLQNDGAYRTFAVDDEFFPHAIEDMLDFFAAHLADPERNEPPVSRHVTMEIIGTLDLLAAARRTPGLWVKTAENTPSR